MLKIDKISSVYSGYLTVKELEISNNDHSYKRVVIDKLVATGVLVHNIETDSFIFVQQIRYPFLLKQDNALVLEIPAGVVNEDENPLDCVIRECEEEVGYIPQNIESITSFYPSPGYTNEVLYLYYAMVNDSDKKSEGGGLAQEHEAITIKELSVSDTKMMLDNQEIKDAKTIIALQWFFLNKK